MTSAALDSDDLIRVLGLIHKKKVDCVFKIKNPGN